MKFSMDVQASSQKLREKDVAIKLTKDKTQNLYSYPIIEKGIYGDFFPSSKVNELENQIRTLKEKLAKYE